MNSNPQEPNGPTSFYSMCQGLVALSSPENPVLSFTPQSDDDWEILATMVATRKRRNAAFEELSKKLTALQPLAADYLASDRELRQLMVGRAQFVAPEVGVETSVAAGEKPEDTLSKQDGRTSQKMCSSREKKWVFDNLHLFLSGRQDLSVHVRAFTDLELLDWMRNYAAKDKGAIRGRVRLLAPTRGVRRSWALWIRKIFSTPEEAATLDNRSREDSKKYWYGPYQPPDGNAVGKRTPWSYECQIEQIYGAHPHHCRYTPIRKDRHRLCEIEALEAELPPAAPQQPQLAIGL